MLMPEHLTGQIDGVTLTPYGEAVLGRMIAEARLAVAELMIQRLEDYALEMEDLRELEANLYIWRENCLNRVEDERDAARRWSARWKRVACAYRGVGLLIDTQGRSTTWWRNYLKAIAAINDRHAARAEEGKE